MYYNTAGYLTAPVVAEYIACGRGLTHPWRYYDRNQLQLANNLAIVLLIVINNRLNIWCILAQRTVDSPNTPLYFSPEPRSTWISIVLQHFFTPHKKPLHSINFSLTIRTLTYMRHPTPSAGR